MKEKIFKNINIAFSPCPNDTFMFYALVHKKIDLMGYRFTPFLEDVETLNHKALSGEYDVSKLSCAGAAEVGDKYDILKSGAALGKGCGPLIVARKDFDIKDLENIKIAVPGIMTTAYLLLSLFLGKKPNVCSLSFEKIMPYISSKKIDAGVIIHEGRFTYEKLGLKCLADLGEWWEKKTRLPIPLGCIAAKKTLGGEFADIIENIIKESICYAFKNKEETKEYIKKYAQEMGDEIIEKHINLYVNDFSIDMGKIGEGAIKTLFDMKNKAFK